MIKIKFFELIDIITCAKHWYKNIENLDDEYIKKNLQRIQQIQDEIENLKGLNFIIKEDSGE